MTLQTVAIATSIAGYSVTGVTIRDLDDFQDEVKNRDTDLPVLMPSPNFFSAPDIDYKGYGTGAEAPIEVTYILRYRFFYAEVGAERGLLRVFQGFIQKLTAIIDVFIANDATTNAIHLQVTDIGEFGIVTDPSENEFFGCDIGIKVTEYIN